MAEQETSLVQESIQRAKDAAVAKRDVDAQTRDAAVQDHARRFARQLVDAVGQGKFELKPRPARDTLGTGEWTGRVKVVCDMKDVPRENVVQLPFVYNPLPPSRQPREYGKLLKELQTAVEALMREEGVSKFKGVISIDSPVIEQKTAKTRASVEAVAPTPAPTLYSRVLGALSWLASWYWTGRSASAAEPEDGSDSDQKDAPDDTATITMDFDV